MQMLVLLSHHFFKVYTVTYIHYNYIYTYNMNIDGYIYIYVYIIYIMIYIYTYIYNVYMYMLWVFVCIMNIAKSFKVSKVSHKVSNMADVCDKELYDLKTLATIDYIKYVSKKKPTKERILKFMARSNLKLQQEVLQMLLNNLEEEGILENCGDDLS